MHLSLIHISVEQRDVERVKLRHVMNDHILSSNGIQHRTMNPGTFDCDWRNQKRRIRVHSFDHAVRGNSDATSGNIEFSLCTMTDPALWKRVDIVSTTPNPKQLGKKE